MTDFSIDQELLDRLKPTCAFIRSTTKVGSGFLVNESLLVTCWHVVDDLDDGESVTCTFRTEPRETRNAKVLAYEPNADVAVLKLTEPLASVRPFPLGTMSDTPGWTMHGYPGYMKGAGITCRGHVSDWSADAPGYDDVIALLSENFDHTPLGGISGSPVVTANRQIVGVIFCVLGADGERKIPHQGTCYAIPVRRFPASIWAAMGTDLKPHLAAPPKATKVTEASQQLTSEEYLRLAKAANPAEIRSALTGTHSAVLTLFAAERLIALNDMATARAVLENEPSSARRSELMALAYSLEGCHDEAQAMLRAVSTSEAGGIRGGIFKRRWVDTQNRAWLEAAYDVYATTFALHPSHYYSGINVASVALLLGNRQEAERVAEEVLKLLPSPDPSEYWELATKAEALCLLGKFSSALELYTSAAAKALPRDVAVMRRQAERNLSALGQDSALFAAAFSPKPAA